MSIEVLEEGMPLGTIPNEGGTFKLFAWQGSLLGSVAYNGDRDPHPTATVFPQNGESVAFPMELVGKIVAFSLPGETEEMWRQKVSLVHTYAFVRK